jgi:GntR family transcriptional regulator
MTVERLDNLPLADRARAAILEAILEKRFSDRLPAEDALADMLNVSRTTIRTALQSLEQDGIITRRRAVGTTINTHVRPATLALQRLVGFDWLLREKGHEVRVEQSWERAAPPAYITEVFDLNPDEDCYVTSKCYYADGRLAIYIRDVVPWNRLREEKLKDPLPASMFEFSRHYCQEPVHHAVVELAAQVKRDESTTRLEVDPGDPFMRLHETHYTSGGEPLAVSVVDVDDEYIRFEVVRHA